MRKGWDVLPGRFTGDILPGRFTGDVLLGYIIARLTETVWDTQGLQISVVNGRFDTPDVNFSRCTARFDIQGVSVRAAVAHFDMWGLFLRRFERRGVVRGVDGSLSNAAQATHGAHISGLTDLYQPPIADYIVILYFSGFLLIGISVKL